MLFKIFILLTNGIRAKIELAEAGKYKWKWHDELRYEIAMLLPI